MGLFDLFKGKRQRRQRRQRRRRRPRKSPTLPRSTPRRREASGRRPTIARRRSTSSASWGRPTRSRRSSSASPSRSTRRSPIRKRRRPPSRASSRRAVRPSSRSARSLRRPRASVRPMRILKEILPEEELVEELLVWLRTWDTEYAKFIDPKLQILEELGEHAHPSDPRSGRAVPPGRRTSRRASTPCGDVRAEGRGGDRRPLLTLLLDEESVRVRAKIADGFVALRWEVPEDQRDAVRKVAAAGVHASTARASSRSARQHRPSPSPARERGASLARETQNPPLLLQERGAGR